MFTTVSGDSFVTRPSRITVNIGARGDFVISPDGSRVAVLTAQNVTVYDVTTEQALFSFRLPYEKHYGFYPYFISPNLIRVYVAANRGGAADASSNFLIYEADVNGRKVVQTGTFDARVFAYDRSDQTLLAMTLAPRTFSVLDARSGATLMQVPESPNRLTAGKVGARVVVVSPGRTGSVMSVYTTHGQQLGQFPLPAASAIRLGSAVSADEMVVGISEGNEDDGAKSQIALVNLQTGSLRRTNLFGVPAVRSTPFGVRELAAPGSISARLIETFRGQVVRLDPATGKGDLTFGSTRFRELD
jgi:hypothetical protein